MARRLLPALLAVLLVTAGCNGLAGQTTTTTGTTEATTAVTTTTTTATEAAETETTTEATTTSDEGSDPDVDADALKREALAAMVAVDTYRVNGTLNQTIRNNRLTRRINASLEGAFERPSRRLRINQTVTALGRQVRTAVYLVDGTLYQYNPQFRQQFDSAWLRFDLSGNESAAWNASDTLRRQHAILNNSTVSLAGTATVAGRETRVLAANATDAGVGLFGPAGGTRAGTDATSDLNVTRLTATYYIDPETGRPVRAVVRLNASVALRGSTTRIAQTATLRFGGYGSSPAVDLPTGADTAVNASETTATETARP